MKIQLTNLQKKISLDEAKLKRTAKKILSYLGKEKAELSVALTNDRRICLLNGKFRKINKSTDVLAFSMTEGEDLPINPACLGDVVVSVETAGRCAKQFNIPREEEIYRYLTHGILHLTGYDHRKTNERRLMKKKEEDILQHLGVSDAQAYIS